MKTLELEVPDRLAQEIEDLVRSGWFVDENEIARQALTNFVRNHRLHLQEDFQREDIRWAMQLKEETA
jgi:Arc/MetJ-type ribon-helix-helix transcriptional regulator